MSMAFCCRFVCLFIIAMGPLAVAAQERFFDDYADAIQTLLDDNFADSNAGMVIGVLDEHGSRVFSAGKLDNGTDREVNGDTIFELGSVTKVFTSLLLLDAVRRGEMKLDDPVAKYLPERVKMPTHEGKVITLLNLAVQDSGLPWHPHNYKDTGSKDRSVKEIKEAADAYTVENLYEFLSAHSLAHSPGAGFHYSNVGMAVLGHVLGRRAGTDYEPLVVSRICRPLKMDTTLITLTPELKARLARGHWTDGKRSEHLNFQAMRSAGSLLSTANDLLKFLSANLRFTETHLGPLMAKMQVIRHTDSPRFGKTAMPWLGEKVYNPPGSELLGHGGGGFGNLAFIAFDTKKRRAVVVLTNQMVLNPSGIGWVLLQGMPLTPENIRLRVREVVGVGVALAPDEKTGMIRITTVFPKSPAGQAELPPGLLIQKINGVSIEGKTMQECFGLMAGPAGTKVRLELVDAERKEPKTVELTKRKFLTATE